MKTKIIFFGTPQFAAEDLEYLLEHSVPVVAVVTQPDRPKGRSLVLTPSAVKETAQRLAPQIPIFQPEKCSDPVFLEAMRGLKPDLFVVVAFGQILPQKLIDIPPLGSINVHTSLLPKYRGAAPVRRAILEGETKTGVVVQKLVKQLDAGDVIATVEHPIGPNTHFPELERALCNLSKPLLLSVIQMFANGIPVGTPQDPDKVTYAHKIEPEEGKIEWDKEAQSLHNLVRAFSPRPGAWCWVEIHGEKKRLKILRTHMAPGSGSPGKTTSRGVVYCGEGALQLVEVQPEGKRPMSGADWIRGFKNLPHLS